MITSATAQGSGREIRDSVVIRFAGDSGDGMQVTGSQFTLETALAGNDLATFPDFPAEIRAPAGTTFGVSAGKSGNVARSLPAGAGSSEIGRAPVRTPVTVASCMPSSAWT